MSTRGWTRFIRDIYSCRAYLEAGFRFTPLQCVKYRADYVVIARELNRLAKANDPAFLESIRHLCTSDLFFLLYFVLGVVEVNHPWLIERVYEVADRNDRTVDLWAREHFKSTIINFALTIQDILKNPEERIGIFSHKRHIAQAFLRRIRHSLTTNKLLKAAFPNVLYVKPESQAEKWSDEGFIVKRSGSYDECTVEAWGLVDNLPTSKHYTIRIYDDIVTDESVNTVEMMEKTLHAFRQSHNLQQRGGKVRVIGTIYDYGDVNHLLSQDKMWHVRIHSARDKNGKPVYLTERELEQRLHDNGQWNFDCQYMLNPIERSKRKFDVAWLKYHEGKTSGGNRYIVVDPGKTKKKTSDYTVMWVIEVDGRGNRIVLDGVRDKLTLRETWDALAALIERWNNVIRVGYARAGFERDKEYLHEKQQETGIFFAIQDIQERGDKIRSRISSLQPLFEAGKIIFPKALIYTDVDGNEHNLTEEFIKEEYTRFPSCSHDDMLDCLSMILSEEMKVSKSYNEEPVLRVPYSIFDDTHYDPHAWMNL